MSNITISKETLRRIISDISDIIKNPLHDNGIYYHHDETNILKGNIMIIPKSDSPYKYGYYFFSVEFPLNYPYSPPTFKYLTNNNTTRFHPNLYRIGKVCLSILNTWKGEQWTSCNTLSSILLNITTLFTQNPFLHEPGITKTTIGFEAYNIAIEYQNYNYAIYNELINSPCSSEYPMFTKVIKESYNVNKELILEAIYKKKQEKDFSYVAHIPLYNMTETIDYPSLYQKLKEYNNNL